MIVYEQKERPYFYTKNISDLLYRPIFNVIVDAHFPTFALTLPLPSLPLT